MENVQPLKILFVDDEEGIAYGFQEIYTHKGFVTFAALDGVTAVETFKKERPQICFIDVWMDKGTHGGVEVLRKIREIDKDSYCIMMGPCLDEENTAKETKELGALHFINRRLDFEDIDQYIAEIRKLIIEKNFTIRDLFHDLGNKHQVIIIGMGAVKESVEECLNETNIHPELKEKLSAVVKDLDTIIAGAMEADKKALEVEGWVYRIIDPDTGKVK